MTAEISSIRYVDVRDTNAVTECKRLAIVFAGGDVPDRFAELAIAAIEARDDCDMLRIDAALEALDRDALVAMVSKRSADCDALICLGFGDGGDAALRLGDAVSAAAMLAIAPEREGGCASENARVEVVLPGGSDVENTVSLTSMSATLHDTGLPKHALLAALDQCGWVDAALDALLENRALPSLAKIKEEWHHRIGHHIEIDAGRTNQTADGRMHVRGRIRHIGTDALVLLSGAANPVRLGARVLDADGVAIPGVEGRSGFAKPVFEAGEIMPFTISLPRFDPVMGDRAIHLALVCEGQFWFSDAGFHACRLAFGRDADIPSAPEELETMSSNSTPTSAIATVELLYRALLGRMPDGVGLNHYADMLAKGAIDERTLAGALIGSPEFRRTSDARTALAGYVIARAYGCSFLVPENDGLVAEIEAPDGYEPWVLPYFLDRCLPGMTVLDIGASIGAFSLPAARRVGPDGIVYAIEASPPNCRLLAQSITLNELKNVRLLPIGASDALGFAQMLRQTYTNNNILELGDSAAADLQSHDVVPLLPIDLLRPALGKIDIVKLDIEGMEYRAVKGAIELISSDRPLVFLEYSPRFQSRLSGVAGADLINFFGDLGYRFEILHRDRDREMVASIDPAGAIDAAWKSHVQAGGSHLDLCLHPA